MICGNVLTSAFPASFAMCCCRHSSTQLSRRQDQPLTLTVTRVHAQTLTEALLPVTLVALQDLKTSLVAGRRVPRRPGYMHRWRPNLQVR